MSVTHSWVRALAGELSVDQVAGERGLVHRAAALATGEAGKSGAPHQQLHRAMADRDA
jgi:hypothetical protein